MYILYHAGSGKTSVMAKCAMEFYCRSATTIDDSEFRPVIIRFCGTSRGFKLYNGCSVSHLINIICREHLCRFFAIKYHIPDPSSLQT